MMKAFSSAGGIIWHLKGAVSTGIHYACQVVFVWGKNVPVLMWEELGLGNLKPSSSSVVVTYLFIINF